MNVETSGIVMIGECDIQLPHCTARVPAPITAVFTAPNRMQVDVCRVCLENMVRNGEWEIAGARLDQRIDIAGYDRRGNLQLIVEVRSGLSRPKSDPAQAMQIHRNLLTHSAVPRSKFFLLAFVPQPFYLWVDDGFNGPDAPPAYEFDVEDDVLRHTALPGATASEEKAYLAAVETWLANIVRSAPSSKGQEWLFGSGLHAALEGGSIVGQATDDFLPLSKSA